MRYWGKMIRIDGREERYSTNPKNTDTLANPWPDDFEVAMQNVLRQVQNNPVGKIILDDINSGSRTVTIRPVSSFALAQMAAESDGPGANARGDGPNDAGAGADVTIWYQTDDVTIEGHVYRADDGILHECVHAMRQARGKWRPTPMPGWDNEEEFFGIMVGNIYASAANRPMDMRSSHGKRFLPMQMSARDFAWKYFRNILEFTSTSIGPFNELLQVRTAWNPMIPFNDLFWAGR